MLIIFVLALSISPEIRDTIFKNTQVDTIGHCIGFFILTWILSSFVKLSMTPLVFALIIYAGLSEVGQYYLGFRNGEVKDFVADIVGILLFALLKSVWIVYGKKPTQL